MEAVFLYLQESAQVADELEMTAAQSGTGAGDKSAERGFVTE